MIHFSSSRQDKKYEIIFYHHLEFIIIIFGRLLYDVCFANHIVLLSILHYFCEVDVCCLTYLKIHLASYLWWIQSDVKSLYLSWVNHYVRSKYLIIAEADVFRYLPDHEKYDRVKWINNIITIVQVDVWILEMTMTASEFFCGWHINSSGSTNSLI